MATYRQIVYMVLDEIKAFGGDSDITEEHVIFLANNYRLFLIEQKKKQEGEQALAQSNYQTICLDVEPTPAIDGLPCEGGYYLKSKQDIPELVSGTEPKVYPSDYFNTRISYVTRDRMKFVGFNNYMQNITYATKGLDNRLYMKSNNPQFLYLEQVKFAGIFEDTEKAAELSCDDKEGGPCDIMDKEFPMETTLIPQMIQLIVKELLGAEYRPKDTENDDKDALADLATYIARNAKSSLSKQLTDD